LKPRVQAELAKIEGIQAFSLFAFNLTLPPLPWRTGRLPVPMVDHTNHRRPGWRGVYDSYEQAEGCLRARAGWSSCS